MTRLPGAPGERHVPGMTGRLEYRVVDVFTDRAFAGNPLAVVLDAGGLADRALLAIAREFNLSETAFPLPAASGEEDYRLRIFTPAVELPFAGHPSIGAAWVLAALGRIPTGRVVQGCGAGRLPVEIAPGPGRVTLTGGRLWCGPELDPAPLLAAAGLAAADLAPRLAPRIAGAGLDFAYLPVRTEAVDRAAPDPVALSAFAGEVGAPGGEVGAPGGVTGLAVFAAEGTEVYLRMFAGGVGVDEDPATGSAALGLGGYLVSAGRVAPDGETVISVTQGVAMGRPSSLEVSVTAVGGRPVAARVAGGVVPVAEGLIAIPDRAAGGGPAPG